MTWTKLPQMSTAHGYFRQAVVMDDNNHVGELYTHFDFAVDTSDLTIE